MENPANYWKTYAVAPNYVDRPRLGQTKGYYYFFRSANIKMDSIWEEVKMNTKNGNLGYYCGYSDNRQVIAIHIPDPYDTQSKNYIEEWLNYWLNNYGIDFHFRTKVEEQDLYRHLICTDR